jgi:hypothetical protein
MASAFPVPSADSLAYITKEPTDEKALLKIYEETRCVQREQDKNKVSPALFP